MKDAKVNMNRPPLSEDDIDKAKNFDQLMKMNGEPPIKIKWAKIGGVIAVVVGVLGYIFWPPATDNDDNDAMSHQDAGLQDNVNQDFFSLTSVPYSNYKVNGVDGDTIITETGTRIIIPVNAFKDKEGNPISDLVEINLREFHNVPEIFGSDVDMTYDSAGVVYHFESAGMIEMLGSKNGEEVFINQERPIRVELNSQYPGDHYNIYFMDPEGDWEFVKKDTAGAILSGYAESTPSVLLEKNPLVQKKLSQYIKTQDEYSDAITEAGLVVPQVANDELFSVKLKFKESQFPELKGYKNVLFEVTEKNENFDKSLAQQEWSDIELSKSSLGYMMTLFGSQKVKLHVRPVFASEDMEAAEENFEELFATYDAAHQSVLSAARQQMTEAYQVYKATEDSVINVINQSLNQSQWEDKLYAKTKAVKRVFEVDNFGFWNSDCPQNLPKGQEVDPVFVNAENVEDTLTFTNLFIAEYDKNAFFTYWGNWGHEKFLDENGKEKQQFVSLPFTFNPKSETVLWAITNKGELAVVTPEELSKVSFSKGNATTLKMKVHKKVIDIKKIKEAIGWK